MEVQDSSPYMGQNLPTSNTDKNYTDISQTEKGEIRRCRKWLDEDTKAKPTKNYDSEYTDKGDCL